MVSGAKMGHGEMDSLCPIKDYLFVTSLFSYIHPRRALPFNRKSFSCNLSNFRLNIEIDIVII